MTARTTYEPLIRSMPGETGEQLLARWLATEAPAAPRQAGPRNSQGVFQLVDGRAAYQLTLDGGSWVIRRVEVM